MSTLCSNFLEEPPAVPGVRWSGQLSHRRRGRAGNAAPPGFFLSRSLFWRPGTLQPALPCLRQSRQRRRRHHHPALRRGQRPAGSHLQQAPHSDAHRLASPIPELTLATDKSDMHSVRGKRVMDACDAPTLITIGELLFDHGQETPTYSSAYCATSSGNCSGCLPWLAEPVD